MNGLADTLATPRANRSRAERVQTVKSPAGLQFWLVEDYTIPLVAMSVGFKGGSSQDPAGRSGLAAMLAAMLTEGAGALDSDLFHEELDGDAIKLSFSADRDNLRCELKSLAWHSSRAFELLGLALTAPRFDSDAITRIKGQMESVLRQATNNPAALAERLFAHHAFGDHPYARQVNGELADLTSITREDLVAMHRRLISRGNLKIAIVGAIGAEAAARQVDRLFDAIPQTANLETIGFATFNGTGSTQVAALDIPQSTIQFGRQGLLRSDPDFIAGFVVNHCLGGGIFTSRLFRELREKRGLCYSIYAQNIDLDHAAMLVGSTAVKTERVDEAIDMILAEVSRLLTHGIDQPELEAAQRYLVGSYALRFDTSSRIANLLMSLQLNGYGLDWMDRRNTLISAVDRESAAGAIDRLYGNGELLIAVAGPYQSTAGQTRGSHEAHPAPNGVTTKPDAIGRCADG